MVKFLVASLVAFVYNLCFVFGVIELDSSFRELKNHDKWLVKFYAPWCSHCRRLEPIYEAVSKETENNPYLNDVKVARLDATLYPEMASLFDIHGYPTIKYIDGSTVFTFYGDRTVKEIVTFINRAKSPEISHIDSSSNFQLILERHQNEVLFVYINKKKPFLEDDLYATYKLVSHDMHLFGHFYAMDIESIPVSSYVNTKLLHAPQFTDDNNLVVVIKDLDVFIFPNAMVVDGQENRHKTMLNWIQRENMIAFPQLSQFDLYRLSTLDVFVVLLVVNHTKLSVVELQWYEHGKALATDRHHQWKKPVQFGYMTDYQAANHIVMGNLLLPSIFISHPSTERFYLMENQSDIRLMDSVNQKKMLKAFIEDVFDEKIVAYGGNGYLARLRKTAYELVTGLTNFFAVAPLLAFVICGIPIAVITFLIYALCCLEFSDDDPKSCYVADLATETHHNDKGNFISRQPPFSQYELSLLSLEDIEDDMAVNAKKTD